MKKITLISIFFITACSSNNAVKDSPVMLENSITDLTTIHKNSSPLDFSRNLTLTCAGFAKAGSQNGYGSELDIFIDCLNRAINLIEEKYKDKLP